MASRTIFRVWYKTRHAYMVMVQCIATSLAFAAAEVNEAPFGVGFNAGGIPTQWVYGGDALQVDNLIRLTPDLQSKKGIAYTEQRSNLGQDWRIDVTFAIHGASALFGDGLALYVTEEPISIGPKLGGPRTYKGVGVFIDTFANGHDSAARHPHPYITLIANDGTEMAEHDERMSYTSLHEQAGCSAQVRAATAEKRIVTLRLDHRSSAGQRALSAKYTIGSIPGDYIGRSESEWMSCFGPVDPGVDLSGHGAGYYIGLSAETGALTDTHDVLSLLVYGQKGMPGETSEHADPASPTGGVDRDGSEGRVLGAIDPAVLNAALADTNIVKLLRGRLDAAASGVDSLRKTLDQKIDGMHGHMEGIIERLSGAEEKLDERLAKLEAALKVQLADLHSGSRAAAREWVWPFVGLALGCLALTGAWCVQYRRVQKMKGW